MNRQTLHQLLSVAALALSSACMGSFSPVSMDFQQSGGSSGSNYAGLALGASTIHRLNRSEYNNSVHELLGTRLNPAANFAPDPVANGFDNNADALTLSATDLQFYQTAAETLASELADPNNPHFAKLAPCQNMNDTASCLTKFVTAQGLRFWRRPLSQDEVTLITQVATTTSPGNANYMQQVQTSTTALLMSPYFIFRVELDPNDNHAAHMLTPYELATRLSYFLWSSTPDDTLLAAAADGSLAMDAGLQAQVTRMLADPRAVALTSDFAGQWLELRATAALQPDPNTFPTWDENLRAAMIAQTQMTFGDLLNGSAALSSLFTSDTTYMNDRLAQHYGMPAVGSTTLKKVPAGDRKGLLSQGGVLASTSFAIRTSLVHRGAYVLSQLLCAPPPPPPANVPQLSDANTTYVTQRQRLENHIANPSCATCHSRIDPYGYVLEVYDGIGAARTTDNGGAIIPSATMQDGTPVANVAALNAILATDQRVPACMVQQLYIYALGRSLTSADLPDLSGLQTNFIASGQRVDTLIQSIVMSDAFRMRQGG